MNIWWFYLVTALIVSLGLGFIWIIVNLKNSGSKGGAFPDLDEVSRQEIEHIFSNEFREELRNRGRLLFEHIINENAEFLQQDLRLTSSQLNEFMKKEMTTKVQGELDKYAQSINDARNLAIESIKKTTMALEDQRKELGAQVQEEIAKEKAKMIQTFEKELTEIVSHYIVAAIGSEIDLNDQLDYILADFETNKAAMIEDIKNVGQ
jgi:hypothetical protein